MACKTVGLPRASWYYEPRTREEQEILIRELHRLSKRYPYYGYPMMTKKLCQAGWRVGKNRIQRLWRIAGLKLPKNQRKRRRLNVSTAARQEALYPNHCWAWDFIFDRTEDGRALKILNIVDEFSRMNISLEVQRHFTAEDVIRALGQAMLAYGIPGCIRSDNGPEFIARRLKKWIGENGIGIAYIEPGSPWENPFVESLNGTLRDEVLDRELFSCALEARVVLADWREEYNTERPHSSLRSKTPAEVYRSFIASSPPWGRSGTGSEPGREYLH